MDDSGEISTVIEDHVEWLAVWESAEGLLDTPEVFLIGLTLPGVDWDTSSSDSSSSMVLAIFVSIGIVEKRKRDAR